MRKEGRIVLLVRPRWFLWKTKLSKKQNYFDKVSLLTTCDFSKLAIRMKLTIRIKQSSCYLLRYYASGDFHTMT